MGRNIVLVTIYLKRNTCQRYFNTYLLFLYLNVHKD